VATSMATLRAKRAQINATGSILFPAREPVARLTARDSQPSCNGSRELENRRAERRLQVRILCPPLHLDRATSSAFHAADHVFDNKRASALIDHTKEPDTSKRKRVRQHVGGYRMR
jgi:hypothetical protein